jgi:hypothetical protein
VEDNFSLIKVDWLDACNALRMVGAVLVVSLRRWRNISAILQTMGAKADTRKNVLNSADQKEARKSGLSTHY